MLKPSQVLKFIAMTNPKNAPTKCSAKYNAQNSSFIISSFKLGRTHIIGFIIIRRRFLFFYHPPLKATYLKELLSYIVP